MSNILEALDIFKFFLIGVIQGIEIFAKAFFNVGYPTNILVFLLLFGTPLATFLKFKLR